MRGLTVALFFVGTVAGSAPGLSSAGGFFTSLINPTYNVGPESAWTNPAGMTGVQTSAVAAAVAGVFPIAEFDPDFAGAGGDDGGNAGVAAALASVYAVKPLGDRFRLGFSMLSPFGAVSGSGVDYGESFVGRYAAIEAVISTIAFAPSLGF